MSGSMIDKVARRFARAFYDARKLQAASATLFELAELDRGARDRNIAVIRSLCSSAYLGEGTALCRVLGRYKMFVDTDDFSLSMHLITDGFWELWLTEVVAELVKPGMTAVDIGANLGYFSLMMGELVGPAGSVHAFEPNAELARRLRRSLEINGFAARATVHEVALTDSVGEGLLAIPPSGPGGGHLTGELLGRPGAAVRMETFDWTPALAHADFIKIDVEGFEYHLWQGMRAFVASGRPVTIVMEFSGDCHPDAAAFLDEIAAGGFTIEYLSEDRGIVPVERSAILSRSTDPLLLVLRR